MFLLVAVALAVRVPNLTTHGLYRDDAWPALASRVGLATAVRMGVTVPGYEALLRLWLGVSRATAWAQLPALAASIGGVAASYYVARRLGAGRAGAVTAGAVLALSPVSVLYATRVKQYAFDALAALALIALALRARDRPESPGRCVALVVAAVCVVAFSASVLPVAVVAVLFAARHGWRAPAARRVVAVAVGLFGLFALGWSRLVLRSVPRPLHDSWDHNYVHLTSPWRAAADTWHVLDQFASGVFYRHGPTGPLLVAGLAVATARWHRDVLLLLLGPVAVAVGLAALGRVPLGGGRIDEYLYPGMALAAGLAVQNVVHHVHALAARPRVVDVALMALVVGFAVTAGLRQTRATPYPAADVHALDLAVGARRLPGDGVVVGQFSRYPYALYGAAPVRLVFSPAYSTGFAVVSSEPDVYILPAEYYEGGYDPDAAVRFASGYRRIWYIATDTPAFDTPPSIQQNEYVPEVRLVAAGFHVAERLRGEGAHADLLLAPGGG